jgi:hypothetical protein
VAKEVYAAVPKGMAPEDFVPDRYLVAAAARPAGAAAQGQILT